MLGLIGKALGPYHILEQIGQGGMSSVFKAVDLRDSRNVAIKVLSPYIAHEQHFRARFEREVELLRQLIHPNIVPILDFGEAEGLAYIVMPYIGTGTLQDRVQNGPLDVRTGARVTGQIASALSLAHTMGVVHRDVKPSNVLLDPDGNALLSDFSIAHLQDASQNLTGSALIGTPAYMSPELCRGEAIDARSDQYSFAIMLYQLCTGKLPFEADTPMAVALKHVHEPLPRPRQVNPNLPEGVEAVLVRALAKDRTLRFDSMDELNRAFQTAVTEAMDNGNRKVRTPLFDRSTQIYEKYQRVPSSRPTPWYQRRAAAVAAVALALIACPLSTWAMSALLPGYDPASADGGPSVQVVTPEGLGATVLALMTANAPPPGTEMPLETIQAAVMSTMGAMGITYVPPTPVPTETTTASVPQGVGFPTPTPTRTRTLRPGETPPTPTPTVPSSTPTPTQIPSSTPTVGLSNTPPPSPTSPTQTQAPTNTPEPTNTQAPPTLTKPSNPGQSQQQTKTAAAMTASAAPVDTPTPTP